MMTRDFWQFDLAICLLVCFISIVCSRDPCQRMKISKTVQAKIKPHQISLITFFSYKVWRFSLRPPLYTLVTNPPLPTRVRLHPLKTVINFSYNHAFLYPTKSLPLPPSSISLQEQNHVHFVFLPFLLLPNPVLISLYLLRYVWKNSRSTDGYVPSQRKRHQRMMKNLKKKGPVL